MNKNECIAIIQDLTRSDEDAVRAIFEYTGGDNETPCNAAETLRRMEEITPLFKTARPNIDPGLVARIDRECSKKRREKLLMKDSATRRIIIRLYI